MIMKRLAAQEQRILSLVADDAALLHVATPRVRFVNTSNGPCYEALFNRIELDRATLALPEPLLRIVVAHEVGHATQRKTMLLDFAWTVLSVMMLLSVPCIVFAISSEDDLWRITFPGIGFAFTLFVCLKIWSVRAAKRAAAFELDADAKAAALCGPESALAALEAMAARGHVDAARLDAMRARLVSTSQ
ncbi:M48 family metalloprotease [Caballeronia zhejiangensis]|nr:M48 family metalloprotease [Caballeronia zhejiangensis]